MQTPEYSIRRVRDDEMDLPENKQATYLMPTAPLVIEPGSAQDKKPQPEAPAVATLSPAVMTPMPTPVAAPVPSTAPGAAAPHAHGGGGFWSRFKKMLAGEPRRWPQSLRRRPPRPRVRRAVMRASVTMAAAIVGAIRAPPRVRAVTVATVAAARDAIAAAVQATVIAAAIRAAARTAPASAVSAAASVAARRGSPRPVSMLRVRMHCVSTHRVNTPRASRVRRITRRVRTRWRRM